MTKPIPKTPEAPEPDSQALWGTRVVLGALTGSLLLAAVLVLALW